MSINARITDFNTHADLKNHLDYKNLDFYILQSYCEKCGDSEFNWAGWRKNNRKDDAHRMKFTNCGHYATSGFDKWSHVPKWVWDSVLFYASIGVRYALLPVLVKRESIIRGVKQTFSISKVTAYSLVERANKILDLFESNVRILNIGHVLLSEEWEIDDRFHNRMKVKLDEEKLLQGFANQLGINLSETMQILEEVSSKRGSKKGSYWKFMYPTAVVERKPRYCLSIYVGTERNTETAIKALTAARKISTYEPKRFRCDGHDPFIKAIKIMYPNAEIISKTKEEDISIVNTTETIWSIFNLAVPKKRFRTPKTLAQSLNLARHYYNMLRSQNGLGYKTPLEAIGFSIPPSAKNSWVGLLQFAYQFNRFVEYNKRKWREQFSSMEK